MNDCHTSNSGQNPAYRLAQTILCIPLKIRGVYQLDQNKKSCVTHCGTQMHIKTIPYTLLRGRIYYFNIRLQDQFLRISLKTSDANKALQCVLKINSYLLRYKYVGLIQKELILSIVKKVRDEIVLSVNAYLGEDSIAESQLLDSFTKYYADADRDYHSSKLFYPEEQIKHLKPLNFSEFKLEKIYPQNRSPEEAAKLAIENNFVQENDLMAETPHLEDIILENSRSSSWIKDIDMLTRLFRSAVKIRSFLEAGDDASAISLMRTLNGAESTEGRSTSRKLKLFKDYALEFLEAGEKGQLGTLKNRKKRGKWTPRNLTSTESYMRYVCIFFDGKTLDEIDGLNLDELFTGLIQSLPLGNILPFSKMSAEQIVQATLDGEVDDDQMIASKTVSNYKKVLQSFYRFVLDKRYLNASPIDAMRHIIPVSENARGAFKAKDIRRIIDYCNSMTKSEQKWPFLLMSYTGMRNGEIMQLRKEDIQECEESKILYIKITDKAGRVKTDSSNRRIPIHSQLISLGFLDFVEQSEGKLFTKSSRYLTYFYTNFIKRELDLPDVNQTDRTLTLYSLRHSVATELTAKEVVLSKVQQILGHSSSATITERNYIDGMDLIVIKPSIELLEY